MIAEFRDAMRVLRPNDRRTVLILAAMAAASVGLEVVGILAIAPLMAFLASPEAANAHISVRLVQQLFHTHTPSLTLLVLFLILIGVFALKNLYIAGLQFLHYRFARSGSVWVARRLLELYFYRSVERQRLDSIGGAVRNIKLLGPNLHFTIISSFINVVAECFVIAGVSLLLLWIQPYAAIAAGLLMSMTLALQYQLYGRKVRDLGARATAISEESFREIFQALGARKEIRLRGKEGFFIDRLLGQQETETSYSRRQKLLYAVAGQVAELSMLVAIGIVITVIVLTSNEVFAAFSTIAIFAGASLRLMPSVNRLVAAVGELHVHGAEIHVLRTELAARESEIPAEIAQTKGEALAFKDSIRLSRVSYRYPDRGQTALQDIDLTIRRGEFVGLAGPSGAGKSTLTDILMALIPPSEGRLEVDGADVWTSPGGWRALIGYVPQSVYLMDDTLRRNVAFGEPDQAIDEARVRRALNLAQLDAFVARQPQGLETVLGEGGNAVSGGEKQRIGIARALYHDPAVIVLDEVTSQLDMETEHALSQALLGLKGRKTVLVIAHRLSTVKNCDRVIFLKEGRVQDSAPFDVLARRNADFARMVSLANVGVLPAEA